MKFSIIVPHYDGVISDKVLCQGLDSLSQSTFKDFEVLIYHDGPISRPFPKISGYNLNYKYKETKKRYNDWGHSLRDLGIKEARGEYIVHFNPDNLLDPHALQEIAKLDDDIIICPVVLEGTYRKGSMLVRTHKEENRVLLDGFPPVHQNIDAFQLVMKTQIWRKEGGWYNKTEQGDGIMYQEFCKKYEPRYCHATIGLHR